MRAHPLPPSGGLRTRFLALLTALAVIIGVFGVLSTLPAPAAGTSYQLFATTKVPTVVADSDTVATELGMKFRSSVAGQVTGVRFYKSSTNTGTHTGSLWNTAGQRLATVTFTGETASGWQQANFAAPYAITANTTYVISYYTPTGRYSADEGGFAGAITNGPLTGLANGTEGGNGVYRYGTGGGYPQSTYGSTNYYVDVVMTSDTSDTTKPTIIDRAPAAGATGVSRSTAVTATFSEPVNSASIVASLKNGTATVPTTSSYDATARTLTLTPSATLAATTTYTVAVSGATDTSQNQMDAVSWTFTTTASASTCPCTIFGTSTPASPVVADNGSVSLGVRFRSSTAGYITGLRFYKGSTANGGTHTGTLWSTTGSPMASLTFSSESSSGWQTAAFGAPVAIAAGTTYVASYYAPQGNYSATQDAFAGASVTAGPLTAPASTTGALNGVYSYGGDQFPSSNYRQTNYFVDPIFDTTGTDTVAPTVNTRVPAANATGVAIASTVSATFSENVVDSSIVMSVKKTADGSAVAGSTSYAAGTARVTFTPAAALAYNTSYTATVSGAKDASGNTMTSTSWSFTTSAEPVGTPDSGTDPNGPIAVITSSANPYSKYYAEILRTEGLNEFATVDISAVTDAASLSKYDVVLLAEVPVTASQASALSTWVTNGGNLIAMRPSATLAGLLGITATGGTMSNAYLKVDPSTAPGAGIVSDTIQYHGVADNYTANTGTATVATLYSSATTTTSRPAVTLRSVGSLGGQAAAFSYDLAKSVALTRQGNPAWAGTERDNQTPIRSDDYFFGGTSTDWIDFSKVAIPQADEQQRLLANLIQVTNRDKKPLPRFWYFPNSAKAVIVATGDDHSNNGTTGRFNQWNANSPAACAGTDAAAAALVANWSCLRYSSYLWNGTPLSNTAAASYNAQGFEIGLHGNIGPNNYTSTSIFQTYADQMAGFKNQFPSLPTPRTTRFHAIVFSDWASQPKAEIANGMKTDTNYYYWPGSWIANRPGFMTGSGMAMRFTDTDGTMIDNFQATTQMTDESDQTYPFTIDALLDGALDPTKGYYGSFVANMHTDQATEAQSDALIASATSHGGVPIVSARQLTDWLDGRNASSTTGIGWSGNKLTFTVKVGVGANNLVSMIPTAGPGGVVLSSIDQAGTPVNFTRSTIKGLEYASFKPSAGTYTATYGSAAAGASARKASTDQVASTALSDAPTLTPATVASTSPQTATVSWKTRTPGTSRLLLGTSPTALKPVATVAGASTVHQLAAGALKPGTTYYYRVQSTDTAGRTTTSPATAAAPATLVTAVTDAVAPVASAITVAPTGNDAEVSWLTDELSAGALRVTKVGGAERERQVSRDLTLKHSFVLTDLDPNSTYSITVVSQDLAGNRSVSVPIRLITSSPGVGQTGAATFRTGQTAGDLVIRGDGDGALTLDGPLTERRAGGFRSSVLDARRMVDWDRATFTATLPKGVEGGLWVRTGSTFDPVSGTPGAGWSDWVEVTKKNRWRVEASSRYLQYQVKLVAPVGVLAPTVSSLSFSSNSEQVVDPTETGR